MSRVARRFQSGSVLASVAFVGLFFTPAGASAECTADTQECDPDGPYGGKLKSVSGVEYYENGCLAQWDCKYSDGTQIRHLVVN